MSKVVVMTRDNQPDAPISGHFGKAEWAMAADIENQRVIFLRNEAANGRGVVKLLASQQCSEAIFTQIGGGALGHLAQANIRGWIAPGNITGRQAIELFQQQKLQPATSSEPNHWGGCCCGKHAPQ